MLTHYLNIEMKHPKGNISNKPIKILFSRLHHEFVHADENTIYSLGFPKYREFRKKGIRSVYSVLDKVQLFASSEDAINHIYDVIAGDDFLSAVTKLDRPRKVPSDYAGEYEVFSRYRIPTRRSMNFINDGKNRRVTRIEQAVHLPFIDVESKSNKGTFRFYIQYEQLTETPSMIRCEMTNYGLSQMHHICHLPIVD